MPPEKRRSGPAHHLEPAHDDVTAVSHQPYAPAATQRRTRSVTFVLVNRSCVEFRGHNVRERYVELFRRPPVYNTRTRHWVTTPDRMRDLVALLERLNYDIDIVGDQASQTKVSAPTRTSVDDDLVLDPAEPLW